MMFGYATNETEELIPLPIALAHKIAKMYKFLRENKYIGLFAPDGKCQVSCLYENEQPIKILTIVVSAQTKRSIENDKLRKIIIEELLEPIIDDVDDIVLIKIDVEGFELNVIKGGEKLIRKCSPIIVVECRTSNEFDFINNYLITMGYYTDRINYASTPTYIFVKK